MSVNEATKRQVEALLGDPHQATCERCGEVFTYYTSLPADHKPPRWCTRCARIERHISREESRRRIRAERERGV
jgi:hypothetical protein